QDRVGSGERAIPEPAERLVRRGLRRGGTGPEPVEEREVHRGGLDLRALERRGAAGLDELGRVPQLPSEAAELPDERLRRRPRLRLLGFLAFRGGRALLLEALLVRGPLLLALGQLLEDRDERDHREDREDEAGAAERDLPERPEPGLRRAPCRSRPRPG